MTPDDRLDQDLRTFRDCNVPDGPPAGIVAQTLATLRQGGSRSAVSSLFERIRNMPPIVRIAASVFAVASVTGLVSVMTTDHSGPGVAFADTIARVRAARTIQYTMTIDGTPGEFRVLRMEPGLTRTELPGDAVTIQDRARGKMITLNPTAKMALVFDMQPIAAEDPVEKLRDFKGKAEATLGEKVIDGKNARGFKFGAGGWNSVIWVDAKTEMPIRMESKASFNADGVKTIVYKDFVFDAPLDVALFSTTPPDGFKVNVTWASLPQKASEAPVEKDLVDLLGEFAKLSGGPFPQDLQVPSLMTGINGRKIKPTKDGFDDDTKAWIAKVGKGIGLIWAMPPDSDAFYLGKGVKLGEADKPIFRYRPQGSKTYRVIYGNLTVKDVEPGQIPK